MNSKSDIDCDRQRLSCLVDGELDAAELNAALGEATFAQASDCWRTYHMIGDALRSRDLAPGRCDEQWLAQLRQRLQAEPVVLPTSAVVDSSTSAVDADLARRPAANDGIFRWKMVAGLASFAAVAAIGWNLLGTVQPSPAPDGVVLAQDQSEQRSDGARQVAVAQRRAPAQLWSPAQPPYSVVLRSPELDRLLAAQANANADMASQRTNEFFRNAGYGSAER
mgnify:CR=1 FL=1